MWVGVKMLRIARSQLIHTIFSHQLGQLDTWSSDNLKAFHLTGQKDEEKRFPFNFFVFMTFFLVGLYEIPLCYTPTLLNVVSANYNGWRFFYGGTKLIFICYLFFLTSHLFSSFSSKTLEEKWSYVENCFLFLFNLKILFFSSRKENCLEVLLKRKKWKEKLK